MTAQYDPITPDNVLVLPQLTQPVGELRPFPDPFRLQAVEYPNTQDSSTCQFCQCLYQDLTGWWFPFTGSNCCTPDCDLTGDGRDLRTLCADELGANKIFGSGFPVYGPGSGTPFVPGWAAPEGTPVPTQATGAFTIVCGEQEINVNLQQVCDVGFVADGNGGCIPSVPVGPPPTCPKGCPPDINGNCHCDPPLPLASDGNGFASPVGPFALPVHPILSAASLVSCGACVLGRGEGEELEL